jgi:hypothetical protein
MRKRGEGAGDNLSHPPKRGMFHQHCHINALDLHRVDPPKRVSKATPVIKMGGPR